MITSDITYGGRLGIACLTLSAKPVTNSHESDTTVSGNAMTNKVLPVRGINYDTGVNYAPDEWSRDFWHPKAVKHDMQIIATEIGCTAVAIFGTSHERLRETAQLALEQGLDVWLQPRLIEGTQAETLEHLVETARIAEELQATHKNKVTLNVGCELSLFMKGILPGSSFLWMVMPIFNRILNKFLQTACVLAGKHFSGPLVYSAGEWEGIDWTPFDYVGVDYYRESSNASTYTSGLRQLKAHGKPVIITEFGCCCFKGADKKGGGGFLIVNWHKDMPTVKPGYNRHEQVQADYIRSLIEIYKDERIDGAFVYAFSEPRNVHTDDPQTDLDMASYGIVKITHRESAEKPETWEPKQAFATLTELYRE
jgi:hypothetical protein